MEVLKIIFYIVGMACFGTLTFFACSAFINMRRQQMTISSTHHLLRHIMAMQIDNNIEVKLQQITRMKQMLQQLIEADRFEDAEMLKKKIVECEQVINNQVQFMKSELGDVCEVRYTSVSIKDNNFE